MNYAICQIGARQYMVRPGQTIEVDKLTGEDKKLSVEKVLLIADGDKVEIGTPYLNKTLEFEVLGTEAKAKVRVATYKPKANYRRVKGQRREVSKIKLLSEAKGK